MTSRYWHVLFGIGMLLACVLAFNEFLEWVIKEDRYNGSGHLIHFIAITTLVGYAVFLKFRLMRVTDALALHRQVWSDLPAFMAIVKRDQMVEVTGSTELLAAFGLPEVAAGGPGSAGRNPLSRRMTVCSEKSGILYGERYVLPLSRQGQEFQAHIVFDVTQRAALSRQWEDDHTTMLKVLVNMFEMKDPYSQGHSEAVSNLANELAVAMKLCECEINTITKAGLLHDIGKTIVPQEILNKTAPLTEAEFAICRSHSSVGADILTGIAAFADVADIVRHHHERYDGGGYPAGLRGQAIPLGARILAVADTFDAMTAGRSVRGKRDVVAALAVLNAERGKQFDPVVVDAFIAMVAAGREKKQ